MAIKLKIGSPVVGEDFFGREVELNPTLTPLNNFS
jgi:hypothetical protein